MHRRAGGFPQGVVQAMFAVVMMLAAAGCSYKPAYLQGTKTEVPNRWTVDKVEPARLSEDQRTTLEGRGPPTFIRFFREVETRRPVHAWLYADDRETIDIAWFVDGNRMEDIAVDSDPSAFSSTTRRRARFAVLIGTGVVIVPAVVLLANK
jgi:hypothetical protein